MDVMLFFLYYCSLIFVDVAYLLLRKRGAFSISDAIVLVTTLVISLGGYFNSYGYRYGIEVLNHKIFLDYYIYLIIVPIGLIIGNRIKIKQKVVASLDIKINIKKIYIILLFILTYAAVYFYFIKDSVPLFMLLSGKVTDYKDLAILRLSITHDYDLNFNIPFLLRYYKLIINDLMRFILSIIFLFYLKNKRKYKKLFIITLILTIFFHIYNFEKSGLIYTTLILFIDYILYKGLNFRKHRKVYIRGIFISVFLMVGMYMVFMGAENAREAFTNMLDRAILGQTSAVYYQNLILDARYNGELWGQGVPIFLFDSLLNRDVVNLSREAYEILYPQYARQGFTGTTGGMPMLFLRSNFGYILGTLILLTISIVTGIIDNLLKQGVTKSRNNILVISLYSVMIIYFIQAFIGNFTRVFMLPFILSPQVIIVLIVILFLKLGNKRTC